MVLFCVLPTLTSTQQTVTSSLFRLLSSPSFHALRRRWFQVTRTFRTAASGASGDGFLVIRYRTGLGQTCPLGFVTADAGAEALGTYPSVSIVDSRRGGGGFGWFSMGLHVVDVPPWMGERLGSFGTLAVASNLPCVLAHPHICTLCAPLHSRTLPHLAPPLLSTQGVLGGCACGPAGGGHPVGPRVSQRVPTRLRVVPHTNGGGHGHPRVGP